MCKGLATLPATCLKSAKDIKHKISFLLQKPEPQRADQKQTKEKTAAAAAAAKSEVRAGEVEKWKESFSYMMNSEMGRSVFTNFLRSEFSQENMEFWVACEDYKNTDAPKMAARAKEIYQQFVDPDSPCEVNLDAATREETRQNLKNAGPSCFDEAQKMIYILMGRDSYRRFLKSKLFQDMCGTRSTATQEKSSSQRAKNREGLTDGA